MNKVFISYSSADDYKARNLYDRLTNDGISCFFSGISIPCGSNWQYEVLKGMRECEFVLLLLTPNFCLSAWCNLERILPDFMESEKFKQIMPIMLEECSVQMPEDLKLKHYIDISTSEKFEQNYPLIASQLGVTSQNHRNNIKPLSTQLESVVSINNIPDDFNGSQFIGRINNLSSIHEGINRNNTTGNQHVFIITGLGGIGKTRLAIEYANCYKTYYVGGILWIDSPNERKEMIQGIASETKINLDSNNSEDEQIKYLWQELGRHKTLIVLDNFPLGQRIQDWLPPESLIFTLVTSRGGSFGSYGQLNLERLTEEESLQLLNSNNANQSHHYTMEEARDLIKIMDGLPWALELTRYYLSNRLDLKICDLLDEIKNYGVMFVINTFLKLYGEAGTTPKYFNHLSTMFQRGWKNTDTFQKKILFAISYFANSAVPRRILRKLFQSSSNGRLLSEFDVALGTLKARHSMLEFDCDGDPSLHRLLSAFVQSESIPEYPSYQENIVQEVLADISRVSDYTDKSSINELKKVLPHADFILNWIGIEPQKLIRIAHYVAWQHKKEGQYQEWARFTYRAMKLAEDNKKKNPKEFELQCANMAIVNQAIGVLPAQRDFFTEVLVMSKSIFNQNHPFLVIRQSELSMVFKDSEEFKRSVNGLRETLNNAKNSGDPNLIAIGQLHLAVVLRDAEELEEAHYLLQNTLKIVRSTQESNSTEFKPTPILVPKILSNIGVILMNLGQLREARSKLEEALYLAQQYLNHEPENIKILAIIKSNLSILLCELGEFHSASNLLREVIENKIYNNLTHADIAICKSNLAIILQILGETELALELLETTLYEDKEYFATGYPPSAVRESNLAIVMANQGEFQKALERLNSAYKGLLEIQGDDFPISRILKENLTWVNNQV